MALKIRCGQCGKKISIDEAFAGSICRCPYCTALTLVPEPVARAVSRTRPARPEQPGVLPAPLPAEAPVAPAAPAGQAGGGEASPAAQPHHVPLARPVFVQGVVALVLTGLLVLLIAAVVVLYVLLARQALAPSKPPVLTWSSAPAEEKNPFLLPGPQVAGLALESPAVYVLDCSSSMREYFDVHAVILRRSVLSLGAAGRFNVSLVREEGAARLAESPVEAGQPGDAKVKEFLWRHLPAGASDLQAAVEEAMTGSPKSVVILAEKAVPDPSAVAERAKENQVKVYAVGVGEAAQSARAMEDLCRQTGGQFRQFTRLAELSDWLEAAPALP